MDQIYEDIPSKLSELENDLEIGGTVEITNGAPTKESTVMTLNPNAEEVNLYTAEEIDTMLQNLPSGEGGINLDVQIDGISIVENGVANIPIAGYENGVVNREGLLTTKQGYGFEHLYNEKYLILGNPNSYGYLEKRKTAWQPKYHALLVSNLDKAVKLAMCDGQGDEWTSEEKASARDRMGLGWRYIDTVEFADVSQVEIIFPQEYDEFMIIGDVEGSGSSSTVYPRATYYHTDGFSQQASLPFSDFYPSDKKEHYELVFEKMDSENGPLFKVSGFQKTDYVKGKMKHNYQTTGWDRHFDSNNEYQ